MLKEGRTEVYTGGEYMKEDIITRLELLVGSILRQAGRAGDLFWLQFGTISTILRNGREKKIAQFALNIQCTWRIAKGSKILVASKDKYKPSKLYQGVIENFNWDIFGMNSLDEKLHDHINSSSSELIVEAVEADHYGGIKIIFSNDYYLEVFPDESTEEEFWRLILGEEKVHFIVTGNGIEVI